MTGHRFVEADLEDPPRFTPRICQNPGCFAFRDAPSSRLKCPVAWKDGDAVDREHDDKQTGESP
jgi:hypothetical protein